MLEVGGDEGTAGGAIRSGMNVMGRMLSSSRRRIRMKGMKVRLSGGVGVGVVVRDGGGKGLAHEAGVVGRSGRRERGWLIGMVIRISHGGLGRKGRGKG